MNKPYFIDGEYFEPPKNPLFEKYPKCEKGFDYCCMYCSRCPIGSLFEIPKEDKSSYEAYKKEFDDYCDSHGGFENLIFDLHLEKVGETNESN